MHGSLSEVHSRSDPPHPPTGPHTAGDPLAQARAYKWPAGEHRDTPLIDLPTPFLEWAGRYSWHDHVKVMCAAVLKQRARETEARRLRVKLSAGSIDELLHVVLLLHERIDQLEDRLAAAENRAAEADDKIAELRGEDRS